MRAATAPARPVGPSRRRLEQGVDERTDGGSRHHEESPDQEEHCDDWRHPPLAGAPQEVGELRLCRANTKAICSLTKGSSP